MLAGSAMGTPPEIRQVTASFFPALVASSLSASVPVSSASSTSLLPLAKATPRPSPHRIKGRDSAASFRVNARSEREEQVTPPTPQNSVPMVCEKRFLKPFAGELTFRSAYSRGSSVYHCPQLSGFGPVRSHRNHWGVDISSPTGTPVRAALDGVVSYSRDPRGYGLYARLKFSSSFRGKSGACNSKQEDLEILYAHLLDDGKTPMKTRNVRAGEIVGRVGCSGNAKGMCSPSPDSHLHVTVQKSKNHAKFEPASFLGWNIHTPSERPPEWSECWKK